MQTVPAFSDIDHPRSTIEGGQYRVSANLHPGGPPAEVFEGVGVLGMGIGEHFCYAETRGLFALLRSPNLKGALLLLRISIPKSYAALWTLGQVPLHGTSDGSPRPQDSGAGWQCVFAPDP